MVGARPGLTAAAAAIPVVFFGVCFAYPVVTLVGMGLVPDGRLDPDAVAEILSSPSTRRVAWFTLWQAAASTAATVAVAIPAAWMIGRIRFPGRNLFRAVLVVPFVLPTVVVGTAFLSVLGPDGPVHALASAFGSELDLRRTTTAIVAAHVFFNVAVVARTVGAAWLSVDPAFEAAARTLGAGPLQAWRLVVLPALRPAIAGSAAIVFLFCFTSFGVVKILGGFGTATIEVEIHRVTTQLLDLRTASVLAVVQATAVVAALALYRRAGRGARPARVRVGDHGVLHRPRGFERVAVAATTALVGILVLVPTGTLAWRSIDTTGGPSLAHYRSLATVGRGSIAFVPPLDAVANSLRFGAVASIIAAIVGVSASVALHRLRGRGRGALDSALMLPLGTSAVTVGFGFLVALDEPPLDLRTSPMLIPLAQALVAVPFVIRTVLPALDGVPSRLRDAASVSGAGPARTWWEVDAHLLRRPVFVAVGFAFAISLGEFGATVFIARADVPTVPVAIFRALGQPGAVNVGQAMALSTILMAITAAIMLVVDRAGDARVGGF